MGAGKLGRASKAGGYVGRRSMDAQGRRLGVDSGSLAISRGKRDLGLAPNSENSNLVHCEPLTMHEVPQIPFLNCLPRLTSFEALISG